MKILISGVCGFAGSTIAGSLLEQESGLEIFGLDNFSRAGSQVNLEPLRRQGVEVLHGDVRTASDLEGFSKMDWIIDAAANASVLAGVDGRASSRQLIENNLLGTVNLIEKAREWRAGFVLLSTSRVYSIPPLSALPVEEHDSAFILSPHGSLPSGISAGGLAEDFSTSAPVSLYGASKLASECLALEYGAAFDFPVWINRCGVLAGAGQFGRPDQGIFAYWINAYLRGAPLRYIGFGGTGFQVRDCLHPKDLVPLLRQQMSGTRSDAPRVLNLGGGAGNSVSLAQLSSWCAARFGRREILPDPEPRPYDLPWVVMDYGLARNTWEWQPATNAFAVFEEIAAHAESHPDWLRLSAP